MNTLSPTMQACVEFMKANGDMIHRHPGGFWSTADFQPHSHSGKPWFSTPTVQALVKRKHADYDKWVGTKPFPVRAVLIQPPTHGARREA